MKIVVVGVGALGSHLLLAARNVPAEWKIVDFRLCGDEKHPVPVPHAHHTRSVLTPSFTSSAPTLVSLTR